MCGDLLRDNDHGNGCSRRRFLGYASGALAASIVQPSFAGEASSSGSTTAQVDLASQAGGSPLRWGNLLHLSYNMWCDRSLKPSDPITINEAAHYQPYLRCDDKLWKELTERMANAKMNMLVIDLGDGVRYQSHPEIAVQNAWSTERLRKELARLRKLGLEPIPKLNFSTAHDTWLGAYSRQVSTPPYYKTCEDLIDEVIRLFDKPCWFHLGYDEETAGQQTEKAYLVVRQHELWWHDFQFFVKQVEKRGVRPWIWSDYAWRNGDQFLKRMPKSVVQSNWCYGVDFKDTAPDVRWYGELERHGYDQIPTGSNWLSPKSFGMMVDYCRKRIAPSRLKGFLQTPWVPTLETFRQNHIEAIDQVAAAMAAYAKPSSISIIS
jgi:hypothetical protein